MFRFELVYVPAANIEHNVRLLTVYENRNVSEA